ncbi:hypothetical protein [Solicola gregarius]|uniref:Uncharacterized protein n=1 Tax=Solicola gregarius TaxID=2908642 RepID=A0AA46TKV7_9ACTN|nr:hypothetical protein [Solicola gregarius]UYM06784.1 hypothetical protein L0C25_06840 [Solicola gregarius]
MVSAETYADGGGRTTPREALVFAAVGSTLVALIGVLWQAEPGTYPFGPDDRFADMSLLAGTDAVLAGWLAIGIGVVGLLTVGGLAYAGSRTTRLLLAVAGLQVVVLALLAPDIQILILTAYMLAFTLPPVLLGTKIRDGLRDPRTRVYVALGLGGLAVLGVVGGVLRVDTFADLGRGIGGGFADVGARPLYLLFALAVAACWVGVIASYVKGAGPGRFVIATRAWIARWGVTATWVAALAPVPYALSRLTWLTPWPVAAAGIDLDAEPGTRLLGILLGLVSECCLWLTLGLIRPRGEVFPHWVPYVGGRDVPVMAAVIPGLSGALLLTIAGRSLLQQGLFVEGEVWLVLIMPLWLWGPALAVATLAYWQRRGQTTSGVGDRSRRFDGE